MFTAVLSAMARKWKKSKRPRGKCISATLYPRKEIFSAIKRSEVLIQATT